MGGSGAQGRSIDPVEVQQFAFELAFGCQVSITVLHHGGGEEKGCLLETDA